MQAFSITNATNLKESWQFESRSFAQSTFIWNGHEEKGRIRALLIGLDEKAANSIRQKLYGYTNIAGLNVGDAGDFCGGSPEELGKALDWCHYHGVIPVLLGKNFDVTISDLIFRSSFIEDTALLCHIGRQALSGRVAEKHKTTVNIAYQAHRSLPDHLLAEKGVDLLRLGRLRRNLYEAEPYLRSSDMLFYNLNAFRASDAPCQEEPGTSGLFSEEGCQLIRYAGLSEKMRLLWLYGLSPENGDRGISADLCAQLIWYFLEGVVFRKMEYPLDRSKLKAYVVEYSGVEIPLTFYKSDISSRWWVDFNERSEPVPCSRQDYLLAKNDELSDRLIKLLDIYS